MRTLILGAGALGGYFGARLLAAGRDITFLVRPARAALLAQNGLNVFSPAGDLHLPAPPTILKATETYDLILLSAKAYDLEDAMEAIAPAVGPETAILPMLNGMAHMATLDARFGAARVLGGSCFVSATLAPDGAIHHLAERNVFAFGQRGIPHPHMDEIAATLANANFTALHHPQIEQAMWEKWCFLATFAGSTCLLRANIGEIMKADATWVVLALFQECIAVAEAEGHRPSEDALAQSNAFLTTPGSTLDASMARDLEAGAPIEAYQIIGDLLDRGKRHGLTTPILALAYAHLKAYEKRRLR